jgi:YHS domain-containing protein/copper chaperone CopZ
MTQITLKVPDITCDHCDRTITNALTPVAGIQRVAVDIPTRQVQLEYDPDRVDLEQIKTVLEEEYYPVASVAAAGQTTTPTKENVPMADTLETTAIDPVCGMSVDVRTARFSTDYEGQTYYFCAPGCQRAFEADPARYLTRTAPEASAGCSCCGSR